MSTSFLAVVAQRLLSVVAVSPLLLLGIPTTVAGRQTRTAPIDFTAGHLTRPFTTLVTTTLVLGSTAIPASASAASSNGAIRTLMLGTNPFAGVVLWFPVIEREPGVRSLHPKSKGGYLITQAMAPTFLSFAWIFALDSLPQSLHGHQRCSGSRPSPTNSTRAI